MDNKDADHHLSPSGHQRTFVNSIDAAHLNADISGMASGCPALLRRADNSTQREHLRQTLTLN